MPRVIGQINTQEQLAMSLFAAPIAASIGASVAFLVYAAKADPNGLRAALNAPMRQGEINDGRRAHALIEILKAAAR